jgi:hypothetical protein
MGTTDINLKKLKAANFVKTLFPTYTHAEIINTSTVIYISDGIRHTGIVSLCVSSYHMLNMEVDLQKLIWSPCHVMRTAVLIG